jgi:DNA replication protein DnaC
MKFESIGMLLNRTLIDFKNSHIEIVEFNDEEVYSKCEFMIKVGYQPFDQEAFMLLAKFLIARDKRKIKKGLCLFGNTGVGKTLWMKKFACCKVVSVYNLVNIFVEHGIKTALNIVNPPYWLDVIPPNYFDICIDDFGAEESQNHYGTKKDVLTEIIDERYRAKFKGGKTYITTNLTPGKIRARYGDRILSRISELCTVIEIHGEDLRINM